MSQEFLGYHKLKSVELAIHRVDIREIPHLHQILTTCAVDLKDRCGLNHWMPPNYPMESMLKDANELEVYALTSGKTPIGTFTLETTMPASYLKYGNIHWQILDVLAVYVHKLAVLPDWQGQGLGTWCLQAIERLAADRGYAAVRLDGVKTHSKLLRFYASRGYQQVGELIYNSDTWVDAFVFEKVLAI
jgi:GNAT superfamily N-acetyltransferase